LMAVVCLSLCSVTDLKSRMEGHSSLKIGRKEACDMIDLCLHLEVERSKVKVTRKIYAENQPYFRNSKVSILVVR